MTLSVLGTDQVARLLPEPFRATVDMTGPQSCWAQGDQYVASPADSLVDSFDELSSDLAVWATSMLPASTTRAALGALLLHDAARALLHGPGARTDRRRQMCTWDEYWQRHGSRWDSRADSTAPTLLSLDLSAPHHRALEPSVAALRQDPTATAWREQFSRGLDHVLTQSNHLNVPHTPQHLTLAHSHLVLNRLGFLPHEEAHLGEVARTLDDTRPCCVAAPVTKGREHHEYSY